MFRSIWKMTEEGGRYIMGKVPIGSTMTGCWIDLGRSLGGTSLLKASRCGKRGRPEAGEAPTSPNGQSQ
jgi:hypothetical protein